MYIQFFPTLRCNDSCAFCFNRGIFAGPDVDIAAFRRLADVLSDEGVSEVDILGGEPTLHPHLIDLIGIARSKHFSVSLSSNGSRIELLKLIARDFGGDGVFIGISINDGTISDSLSDFINEHRPLLKGISVRDRFIPEAAAPFLGRPDLRYYAIFMDTLNSDDLHNGISFPEFYRSLTQFKSRYRNLEGVYCSGFLHAPDGQPQLKEVRCPAGTAKLSVLPDGSVYPCYLLFRHPEFRLGNMLSDDFREILRNPVLDYFRRFSRNECPEVSCELQQDCHGGCPAVSLLVRGSLEAPDPRCIRSL